MNLQEFKELFFIYLVSLIVGTLLFIASFWTGLFTNVNAVLIKAMIFLLVICLVIAGGLFLYKKNRDRKNILTYRDIMMICLILFLSNHLIYGLIPFNVSRSNSIIMLGLLYNNPNSQKTEKEITDYVSQKYYIDYKAINIRLKEQVSVGNLKKEGNKYQITEKGLFISKIFKHATSLYNVDNNFLEE
jgi:hypothetical protein